MLDDGDQGKRGNERDHVEQAFLKERLFLLVPDENQTGDGGDVDREVLIEWQYGRPSLLPLGL